MTEHVSIRSLLDFVPSHRISEIRQRTAEGYGWEDMQVRWGIPPSYVRACWAFWRQNKMLRGIIAGQV